jgi:hypothetical protein
MKKFAKISLAAAVAVAGLSSVASAKPLEEAIKGVDATGYVTYQYNDRNTQDKIANTKDTDASNHYKAGITLTIPATDDVKVKVAGSARTVTAGTTTADGSVATNLTHAHFIYTGVQNLTVIAGKQALNTPWTQGSSTIDATQFGTGVLALYNAGFATFAGGYITNNNINPTSDSVIVPVVGENLNVSDSDISVAAAIVPMGDVATAQVWYAQVAKSSSNGTNGGTAFADGLKALHANLDVNLMDVAKLSLAHSTLKASDSTVVSRLVDLDQTNKLTKAVVSGSAGPVNLALGYGRTGKNGGLVAFDNDASANFLGWDVGLNGLADARAYMVSADMDVLPALNVGLAHVAAKQDAVANASQNGGTGDLKVKETYATAKYTFAKNLYAMVMLGEETSKDGASNDKTEKGRLEIGFTF